MIRLKLRPEVSTLDFNNGVILSGFRIPALDDTPRRNRRRASRRPVVRDRRIDEQHLADGSQAIPILSKLPIIGNLFKSKAERAEQTELMVLITPRLVRALDPDEVPLLPTRPEDFIDPTGDEEKTKPPGMKDGPEGQGTAPRPVTVPPGAVKRPPPVR